MQGIDAARPWYEKHHVTFPSLVDPANALGRTIGYTAVPNMFYVDGNGVFQGKVTRDRLAELLHQPMTAPPAELPDRIRAAIPADTTKRLVAAAGAAPNDFVAQLSAGRSLLDAGEARQALPYLERAATLNAESTDVWMTLAAAHLAEGDKPAALVAMNRARSLDPKNWLIRKQIWALEHPDRFYDGPVDFAWQRQQLALEAAQARKGDQ